MGRIRRLFKGTLPMFSALWLGMMLVLLWLNSDVYKRQSYISLRPSRARMRVASSAYSRWLPTGMP